MPRIRILRTIGLLLAFAFPLATSAMTDAERELDRLLQEGGVDSDQQPRTLVRAAFLDPSTSRPVRVLARQRLVEFGHASIDALREGIHTVPDVWQADLVTTMIQARNHQLRGEPTQYMPALEESVWFCSLEAKRIAIRELSAYSFPPSLLTMIDAAYEHPELVLPVAKTVGQMGNDRARFFLEEVLGNGEVRARRVAATALARIRGRSVTILREASRDEDPEVRKLAVEALLPYSGLEDLTVLYEFLDIHSGYDPELHEKVRKRAEILERIASGE